MKRRLRGPIGELRLINTRESMHNSTAAHEPLDDEADCSPWVPVDRMWWDTACCMSSGEAMAL